MNSFNFGGQNADPEIVRENFNKIARYLTAADACVLSLQSESANISALGANAAIRTFTVFMRSDTVACDVTIPDPAVFDYSVIGKKDTLFFFKGLSGASTKTVNINAGTVEGAASFTLANDQTVCIQSDGTEYKILFDSTGMVGGSGDTFVESVTGDNVDNTDPLNPVILTPGIDSVLAVAQALTEFRNIDLNGQEMDVSDAGGLTVAFDPTNGQFYVLTPNGTRLIISDANGSFEMDFKNTQNVITMSDDGTEISNSSNTLPIYIGLTHSGGVGNPVIINARNFANDGAAAAGSPPVPINGIYHNAGALRIRLT